ncbi:uncharacterized protein isoform X2 [Choristoneura fumiferana]|uniref:uncharacterized protein isoform X2 n=1 Tax=Choristoneura fumiferana TaxID=7141 RepID=UPI003D15458C
MYLQQYLPRTHSQSQEEPVHSLSLPGPGKDQSLAPNLAPIRVNMHLRSRRQDAEQPAEIVEETNNDKYDPNRGFEPYWPGGEWVFIKRTTKGTTKRTTTQPKLCGTTCNHLLKKMGKVCGHKQNEDYIREWYCPEKQCNGIYFDELVQFTTFQDYCEFMRYQCDSKVNEKWIFIHMGTCEWDKNVLYKPIQKSWHAVSRAERWITLVSRSLAKYSSRTVSWG